MISLEKGYLTTQDVYLFDIEGVLNNKSEGDQSAEPTPKVEITFVNGSLTDVEFLYISEVQVAPEDWWMLQREVANKIVEIKEEYNNKN